MSLLEHGVIVFYQVGALGKPLVGTGESLTADPFVQQIRVLSNVGVCSTHFSTIHLLSRRPAGWPAAVRGPQVPLPKDRLAGRRSHYVAVRINGLTANQCFLDHTLHGTPFVGRYLVPVLDDIAGDNKVGAVIEHDKIGIAARRDAALASGQAGKLRGLSGHPINHLREWKAALTGFGPDQWQPELQGGYASPCLLEIAAVQVFQLWNTGRVI